jgi:hypothetical protein
LLFCFPSSPACFACKSCSINLTDLTKKNQHQDQPQRPLQHSLFKNNNKYPALFCLLSQTRLWWPPAVDAFDSPNSMASASSPVISRVFRSKFSQNHITSVSGHSVRFIFKTRQIVAVNFTNFPSNLIDPLLAETTK